MCAKWRTPIVGSFGDASLFRGISMPLRRILAVPFAAMLAAFGSAQAQVTFTANDGGVRDASATFEFLSSSQLRIVLTNTSTFDVVNPSQVLTGLFFDIAGSPTLSATSAVLTSGSSVIYDSAPAGGVVGGEWAYASGLSGAPLGADYGIASAGFGLFGESNLFPGADLASPLSPNGVNYGLVSAGDNAATGNGGIMNSDGLIRNSVTFTMTVGSSFALSDIGNVSFQYGTALSEPNVTPPIPEPETYAMLLAGLGLMGFVARRRQRNLAAS
jgi:PEP-CTERM motif-containing protein